MPPGTPHLVFTITNSLVQGKHFYHWSTMDLSIWSIFDIVAFSTPTNSHYLNGSKMLRRMIIDLSIKLQEKYLKDETCI